MDYLIIVIPIIGLVVNVCVQLLSFRCIRSVALLKSVYLGFTIGYICLLTMVFYWCVSSRNDYFYIVTNSVIYTSLGYCYFNFICLGQTGRRIRILDELSNESNGLTLDALLERYNARDVIDNRINRLLNNGQIICRQGKYFIGKPMVLNMSKLILMLKLLIQGKKSEFDR
ncbi:MAG: hypothetical protein P9M13_00660 [Candidatus Ancaeobacter aquaticus]|nr:hypothetical protein [Candidatus Ancaeobacter aquaticus]